MSKLYVVTASDHEGFDQVRYFNRATDAGAYYKYVSRGVPYVTVDVVETSDLADAEDTICFAEVELCFSLHGNTNDYSNISVVTVHKDLLDMYIKPKIETDSSFGKDGKLFVCIKARFIVDKNIGNTKLIMKLEDIAASIKERYITLRDLNMCDGEIVNKLIKEIKERLWYSELIFDLKTGASL